MYSNNLLRYRFAKKGIYNGPNFSFFTVCLELTAIRVISMKHRYERMIFCEHCVGTVFHLPSPDAAYRRDEEKKRSVGGYPALFRLAQSTCSQQAGVIEERKRLSQQPSHVT
jgi:hypothetical protein